MAETLRFPSSEFSREFLDHASPKSIEQLKAWSGILNLINPQQRKQILYAYFLGRNDQLDVSIQRNRETLKELEAKFGA